MKKMILLSAFAIAINPISLLAQDSNQNTEEDILIVEDQTSVAQDNINLNNSEEVPMDVNRWMNMSEEGKIAYAKISYESLNWSPAYKKCISLNHKKIKNDINEYAKTENGTLLVAVVLSISKNCPNIL